MVRSWAELCCFVQWFADWRYEHLFKHLAQQRIKKVSLNMNEWLIYYTLQVQLFENAADFQHSSDPDKVPISNLLIKSEFVLL